MIPLCGAFRSSVAHRESAATPLRTTSPLHHGVQKLPTIHAASTSFAETDPNLPPGVENSHAKRKSVEKSSGEVVAATRPPAQPLPPPVKKQQTTPTVIARDSCTNTKKILEHHERASLKSPLLPAPNSILVGGQIHLQMELGNSKGRRTSKGDIPLLTGAGCSSRIPALCLDNVRLPPLSVADVSAPAEATPPTTDRDALHIGVGPAGEAGQHDAPSQLLTPHVPAQAASHDALARRISVHFVSAHASEAVPAGETAGAGCNDGSGTDGCSLDGAQMVTPRSSTPHRRYGEVRAPKGGRASDLSSRSGSLRPDSPPPLSNRSGARSESGSCFVPLSLTPGLDAVPVSSRGGGSDPILRGPDGTPTSTISFLSPTSILLKSNTAMSPSSNGATLNNAHHPSWHSSPHSGTNYGGGGGWGSRRALRDPQATTPVRRHSSASMPHFVEADLRLLQRQQQLSRHDSDSSDDARTIESVVSTVERMQRRRDARSSSLGASQSVEGRRERQEELPLRHVRARSLLSEKGVDGVNES